MNTERHTDKEEVREESRQQRQQRQQERQQGEGEKRLPNIRLATGLRAGIDHFPDALSFAGI